MTLILAIDTSCDETSAAVTDGRKVLSNVISSQIDIHKKYGGVFPALAKRAHQERIDFVTTEALKRASKKLSKDIKAIAVTYGPGLAIALEVGIRKAKELVTDKKCEVGSGKTEDQKIAPLTSNSSSSALSSSTALSSLSKDSLPKGFPSLTSHFNLPLIAVNHLEGHIYSCLAQNSHGSPERKIAFPASPKSSLGGPALCLIVSGGHTQLVLMKGHGVYQVIGATLDDACGEALDKAARILKLGYPGGPIIERLAEGFFKGRPCGPARPPLMKLNAPLKEKSNLNFSYSGLKTQLLYLVEKMPEEEFNQNLLNLAASFQEACFEQITRKTSKAIDIYHPKTLLCGGGVIANKHLRTLLRKLAKQHSLLIYFPPYKNLITDNAAMIGVAAYYKFLRREFVKDIESLEREPRLSL